MPSALLLAQVPRDIRQDEIIAYLLITIALVVVSGTILFVIRSFEAKLILLGLVVAVTGVGYGSLIYTAEALAGILMKIGVILVLGGLACSLTAYLGAAPRTDDPLRRGPTL